MKTTLHPYRVTARLTGPALTDHQIDDALPALNPSGGYLLIDQEPAPGGHYAHQLTITIRAPRAGRALAEADALAHRLFPSQDIAEIEATPAGRGK